MKILSPWHAVFGCETNDRHWHSRVLSQLVEHTSSCSSFIYSTTSILICLKAFNSSNGVPPEEQRQCVAVLPSSVGSLQEDHSPVEPPLACDYVRLAAGHYLVCMYAEKCGIQSAGDDNDNACQRCSNLTLPLYMHRATTYLLAATHT